MSADFRDQKMEKGEDTKTTIIINPSHSKFINGRLPPDSLLQIWAKLPLKSLYKFRSVCKLWNSLISSDPLLPHLRHPPPPPPPPNLLLILRHLPNELLKIPDRPAHLSARPIESILQAHPEDPHFQPIKNGFTPYVDDSLHLLPSKGPLICFSSAKYFYLCNPSTQEFLRVLPGQDGHFTTSNGGFGYLGPENRYVLAWLSGQNCCFFEFGPGEAGFGSWKGVKSKCPGLVRGFGLMVNGSFYWTLDEEGPGFVVCLDVKEEEFRVVPPPEGNENEVLLYDLMYLVEFKGGLCAVDNFSRPPRMQIWMLHENNEGEFSWVRKFNIFISGMDRDLVYPFCDYEGENGGEMVLCNGTRNRLYCYNLKTRSIKQVYKPKHRTSDRLALYAPGPFPLCLHD